MCGIAGIVSYNSSPDSALLDCMLKAMVHRGPDDEGCLVEGPVAMGMRRLSIIDLAGGHQPISNEDRAVSVVFNGEIYNYLELRCELEERGHVFETHTDTETLVHAYEEYGLEFVRKLNGMFAIALWDRNHKRFLLIRDHVGIKPLYWRWLDDTLWFASELKCFKSAGIRPWEVNRDALARFIHLGFIPRELSPIQQIQKLLPGQILVLEQSKAPTLRYYWKLSDYVGDEPPPPSGDEALDVLLRDAVRLQLRSDVPLGAFLSGGLDSSVLSALAAKELPRVSTFGIGFKDHHFDETPYARMVADHIGSRHHEQIIDPGMLTDLIDKLAWHLDEPNGDPAMLPSYLICKYSREHVKVALSGAGGDELFAGYPRHLEPEPNTSRADVVRSRIPLSLRSLFFRPMRRLFPSLGRLSYSNNMIGMGYWADLVDAKAMRNVASWAESFSALDWIESVFNEVPHADEINKRCYYDTTTYLPDQILAMTDRASMAVSLEVRVPMLDIRLIEKTAAISGVAKISDGGKTILKQMAKPLLPHDILTRRKLGFALPVVRWMTSGPIAAMLRGLPESSLARDGYINAEELKKIIINPELIQKHAFFLWNLIMLDLWYRQYVG
ncbi:MAG TPA: asparagine synthase (glutamine-hydrolyzing) [Kiritimatiellia bacterium]|nr:asparagine synthase (glutamine-hydrolyzing) [Kiritimatiellia bacterium]